MRVAVFYNLSSGGAKRALFEQVRRFSACHEIDLFAPSCANNSFCDLRPYVREHVVFPFSSLPLLGSPFGRLNQLIRLIDLARLRRLGSAIAARIDRGGYDVVYVNPSQYTNSPTVLHYLSTPSVFYCQEPLRQVYDSPARRDQKRVGVRGVLDRIDPLPALYKVVLAREDKASFRAATRVLANSKFSKERFSEIYGISAEVCYLGVDTDKFRPLGLSRRRWVTSVGALRPNKGFDFLIKSLALIPSPDRPPLIIVSNYQAPRERDYLANLARELGVELRLRLLVGDDELVKLYNQAALTLYAPFREPFGLVPLESMACGTPVIGVMDGGVCETIVDGVTGILVQRDADQFALAVSELLHNGKQREQYGHQARKYVVESWTWEWAVENLERHLSDIKDGDFGE